MVDSPKIDIIAEVGRVLRMEAEAIQATAAKLGQTAGTQSWTLALELLRGALDQGGKIVVTGVGKSGKVGQKIAATLSSTGSLAVFLHPTEGLHGDLGLVTDRDAVLALSYTGNTEELARLFPSLKALGVPVVAICGNGQSRLVQNSAAWIDAAVEREACPHNLAPTTSTTLALAIGDAIAVTLMQLRSFDQKSFAQNHPGGSLGRKLHLRVSNVMHSGAAAATVSAQASMDEVVVELTRKKLGAVLVIEGQKLLGIITDGDLRRALQHKERFFSLKAEQVMTRNPVTVDSEAMATEALQLMENRPSQIAVLPVLDASGAWIGIVRLHDLISSF
jgi:arabinose-5-phosphate isomerase